MPTLPRPNLTRCPGRTGHCGGRLFFDGQEWFCLGGHRWQPYGFEVLVRDDEHERRLRLSEQQTRRRDEAAKRELEAW